MNTPLFVSHEVASQVARAAALLVRGGVVGYPSETVWGLAAHPASPAGLAALVTLKGRDPTKPVQVSCLDVAHARPLTRTPEVVDALAELWPGPLTLVLPASDTCPSPLAPGGWVGLRLPDHPVASALLAACGGLLATTSLNPAGRPAARTFAEAEGYDLGVFLLPDGGVPARGEASTVVRVGAGGELEVLREGALPVDEVRARLEGRRP
ncbi:MULTISPECIES: L-threonylcarbamoyladenylate synthase [Deinococcus]|uniref:L-threonylcarbamoyladenylate synthase n=1 Tax=Deinococcus TaxID=1298 RepID=UPI00048A1DDA|nr:MULTISPECIES: L-threonylcarbamoyladenylate synthase [Deinococcus]KEF33745.1 translation factor Sua5 [Deinococcus sp. RL]